MASYAVQHHGGGLCQHVLGSTAAKIGINIFSDSYYLNQMIIKCESLLFCVLYKCLDTQNVPYRLL